MKQRWLAVGLMLWAICMPVFVSILPASAAADLGTYSFTNANTIAGSGNAPAKTFTKGTGDYENTPPLTCHPAREQGETFYTITVGSKITGGAGGYNGTIKTLNSGISCDDPQVNGAITIADPNGVGPNGGNKGTATTPPTTTSTATPTLSCNAGFNPLNWLLCAAVEGMVQIANELDNLINSQLSVGTNDAADSNGDPTAIFGTSNTAQAYKSAWSSFRNIALGLLVVASLIVVIATALGMEVLDAYTIRKVLPRIIIVAVAITLSWDLMQFFVQLTNDLGYGIRFLIYDPFSKLKLGLSLGGAGGVAITLIGGAAITALGIFGLLLFALTAALSLFTGYMVMILRQIIITVLIIVAPVAIVCYILPNTQRVYHLWWNTFARALLMFPIIAGIIAAGHVFAAVADQDTANPINQMVAFAAYFGVFLLIPKTWSLGGAAVAGVGNAVNGAAQGSFAGLRKKRSQVMGDNVKRTRAGQRWNKDFMTFKNPITGKKTGVGHIANRLAVNAFDQDELLRYRLGKQRKDGKGTRTPLFTRYAAKVDEQIADSGIAESIQGLQEIDKHGGMHYTAFRAAAGAFNDLTGRYTGHDAQQVRQADGTMANESISARIAREGFMDEKTGEFTAPSSLEEFEKVSEIMQHSDNAKEALGGKDLAANAGYLATIRSAPGMEYASAQNIGALGLARAGRADPKTMASIVNNISATQGAGVGQRMLKQMQKVAEPLRPDERDGHGIIVQTVGGKSVYASAYDDPVSKTALDSVASISSQKFAGAKGESIDVMKKSIVALAKGDWNGSEADIKARQREMQQHIAYQFGEFGPSEVDVRARWVKIAEEAGITVPPVQIRGGDVAPSVARPEAPAPPSDPFGGGGGPTPGAL